MGADRRGPLAAFIVVAIIAAVLLVTSVRSQAAPWLDPDGFPTSIVAGPVTEPHLWGSVTDGVDQVVQDGAVLVRRAASTAADGQDTTTDALGAVSSLAKPPTRTNAAHPAHRVAVAAHQVSARPHQPATTRHHGSADPGDAPQPPAEPPRAPSVPATPEQGPSSDPDEHDHGRHVGREHAKGHRADPSDDPGEHDSDQGHAHDDGDDPETAPEDED